MAESTPLRPRTTYRRYLWDPSTPIPRATLYRHRRLITTDPNVDEGTGLSSSLRTSIPESCSPPLESSMPTGLSLSPSQVTLQSQQSNSSSSPDLFTHSSPELSESREPSTHMRTDLPETPFNSEIADTFLQPAYSGANITVCGAYCSIMQYVTANKLTYTAIEELLKLLQVLCPCPNNLPTTLYKFKRFFQQYSSDFEQQRVCCKCFAFLDKGEVCSACVDRDNPVRNPEFPGLLIHTPFQKPLQTILSNSWEHLQHTPSITNDGSLHDIWDGTVLREKTVRGKFYSNPQNLGLMLSTDGISLFKSSTIDLWPVYLVILNLPPDIRMNAQNVVLVGLWYGSKKPPMHLLLEPIMKKLRQIQMLGVTIETPHGPASYRAKLELAVFDLPAKAAALCSKQFNGRYGCSVCLHPGEYSNYRRLYAPTQYSERTHQSVVAAGRLAEAKGDAVRGVKGISPLYTSLDLVDAVPVDYMHAVLEGVTRRLLRYWFLPKYHAGAYYLGSKLKTIDMLLLRQQPPHELSRPPRSLQKHLKYLKASELRTWLLFYSLPLLLDNLPPLFFHHYALLVCAMHILLQDNITLAQVDAAESMLGDFCKLLPELYGDESCTSNAHLLFHLPKYVRLWGPLWTHSTFGFENKNGQLKRLFHSRGNIVPQLMFNVDVAYTLQLVHHKLAQIESSETMAFLSKSSRLAQRSNMSRIGEHTYIIGPCRIKTPSGEQSEALGGREPVPCFSKLYKNGVVYHASTGVNHGKRDSTVCSFKTADNKTHFGRITLFVNTTPPFALVREFNQPVQSLLKQAGPPCRETLAVYKEFDLLSSFITVVNESCTTPLLAIPITFILGKVVVVKNQVCTYVVKQPNQFEHH